MLSYLAHAGEDHIDQAEAMSHFWSEWYIALPVFTLAVIGVGTIAYLAWRRSITATFYSVLTLLLVVGIAGYQLSAPISILSLSLGFGLILAYVLAGLRVPQKPKKK